MAQTISAYNHLHDLIGAGTVKEGNVFKAMLLNSSHAFDATDVAVSDISANEVANGSGYSTGGVTLTNVVIWNGTPGSPWKFDFDDLDPGWTANGGAIGPYQHVVIYDSTADKLLFNIDLDDAYTAADGAQIKAIIPAAGLATITAA